MRRHESLRPLSRGHQRALFHARELRWDPGGALQAFLAYARDELPRHIEAEERVLFPALLARIPQGDASLARAREAHAAILDGVARLRSAAGRPPSSVAVRGLARLVHDHVRDEERTLYPLAERVLGPEGLAAVARELGGARVI